MTRQRIHEMVDLVLNLNELSTRLDNDNVRASIGVDGKYETGAVWIHTNIGTPDMVSYTYVFSKYMPMASEDIYDPGYVKAEAHIKKLIADLEQGVRDDT